MDKSEAIARIEAFLLSLDSLALRGLVSGLLATLSAQDIAAHLLQPALERIGEKWQRGELALSQVYMSGKLSEQLLDSFLPAADPQRKSEPKMAIAVLEDYHFLGKRIVHAHLRASGFELLDYGRREAGDLAEKAGHDRLQVLLISTLMYPSALRVREVRARLDRLAPQVRILVGGAPFNLDETLWRSVGADAMGRDAAAAARLVVQLGVKAPGAA